MKLGPGKLCSLSPPPPFPPWLFRVCRRLREREREFGGEGREVFERGRSTLLLLLFPFPSRSSSSSSSSSFRGRAILPPFDNIDLCDPSFLLSPSHPVDCRPPLSREAEGETEEKNGGGGHAVWHKKCRHGISEFYSGMFLLSLSLFLGVKTGAVGCVRASEHIKIVSPPSRVKSTLLCAPRKRRKKSPLFSSSSSSQATFSLHQSHPAGESGRFRQKYQHQRCPGRGIQKHFAILSAKITLKALKTSSNFSFASWCRPTDRPPSHLLLLLLLSFP